MMSWVQDVTPEGHSLRGHRFYCDTPADAADELILFHRDVCIPELVHIRGPDCLCEPVIFRRGEVEAPAFWDSTDYRLIRAMH
jgi:hypothetical protein